MSAIARETVADMRSSFVAMDLATCCIPLTGGANADRHLLTVLQP